jgi:hypothetical protein
MNWNGTDAAGVKHAGNVRFIDKDHVDWSMVVTGPEEKIVVELPAKTNLPQAVKTRRTGRWRCWYSICFEALFMLPNGTFPNDDGELRQICARLQRRGRILAACYFLFGLLLGFTLAKLL